MAMLGEDFYIGSKKVGLSCEDVPRVRWESFVSRVAALFIFVFVITGVSFSQPAPNWFRDSGGNQNTAIGAGSGCTGAPLWFASGFSTDNGSVPPFNVVAGPDGNLYAVGHPSYTVYALDASTGLVKWTVSYPLNNQPNPPTIGADGTVYVSRTGPGSVIDALDPSSGAVEWSASIGSGNVNSSPIIDSKGTVYTYSLIQSNTNLPPLTMEALSGKTGAVIWSSTAIPSVTVGEGAKLGLSPDEQHLYFGYDYLYCFNTLDGSIAWKWGNPTGLGSGVSSPPIVGPDGSVYIVDGEGSPTQMNALDGQSGALKWTQPYSHFGVPPSLSPDGKTLYVEPAESYPDQLEEVDTSSGNVVSTINVGAGQLLSQPGGFVSRSACGSDGTLYIIDMEGPPDACVSLLYAINPDPEKPAVLWCAPTIPGAAYEPLDTNNGTFTFFYDQGPTVAADGTVYAFAMPSEDLAPTGITAFGTNTLSGFSAAASSLFGGTSTNGSVQVSQAAGPLGAYIKLQSNNPAVKISSELVPEGATSKTFAISAQPVSQAATATLTAQFGTKTRTVTLNVVPAALSSLTASSVYVHTGSPISLKLQLNGKAGPAGVLVNLSSSNAAIPVPNSVTLSSGSTAISLPIQTSNVSSQTTAMITATEGSITRKTEVTLVQSNFYVSPSSVIAGNETRGVAQIQLPAAQGGYTVNLRGGTSAVQVPSSVTIPAGLKGVSFPITTSSVTTTLNVELIASFGAYSMDAILTVTPGLARVYVSPAAVVGGQTTHGVVQLSGPTSVGQTVSLSSSSSLVTLPSTVTVPTNSAGVSFLVYTKSVARTATVVITAREGGNSKSFTMTLDP